MLSILASFTYAKLIDGVALTINDEPITLFEIDSFSKKYKMSTQDAVDVLLQKKIEESEINKHRIFVNDFEIKNAMQQIAKRDNLSLDDFQDTLKQQGIDLSEYKEKLRDKIKRDKLYKKIASEKLRRAEEIELERYYRVHIDEFSIPEKIEVIEYLANSRETLLNFIKNPMQKPANIATNQKTLHTRQMHPKLLYVLNQTKESSFSPILNADDRFVTLYIKRRLNVTPVPYEMAKQSVFAKVMAEKEKALIVEYFEKIKAEADIKVIRKP